KTNDATSFDEAKNNMAQEAQSLIEKDDQTTKKDTPNDAALDTSQNDPDSSVDKKDAIQAAEKRTEIKSKAKQNKKGETSEINIKETAQDISYSIQGDGTKTNIDTKTTDLEKVDEGSSALSSKKPTTPLEISEEISKKATLYYKEQAAGTTYYVQNAGIILLHPFLSHYFKGLELLEGKAFKDREAQQLAVHLLQYLATQQEQTAESDLLLMKFLCHLPLNYPVNRFMVLPENAKAEAENLLQAALNHWGALPNTTPNGLREGFLKRDGKLEKRGDAWHLVVEQKTIDILLARLPWNLSLVKLPWKKGLVYVEWNK
ncbi:MAG: contractile injection system tape measure protein, partial [Bacteroidota bacterium]